MDSVNHPKRPRPHSIHTEAVREAAAGATAANAQISKPSAIPKTLERLPTVGLGKQADLLELDSASAARSLEDSTCLSAGRGCRPASRCWSSAGLPAFGCRHIRRDLLEVPTGIGCSSEVSFPCGMVFRHATPSAAVHRTAANSTARAQHGDF